MALLTSIIVKNLTTEVSNTQCHLPSKNLVDLNKTPDLKTFKIKCFIHPDYPSLDSYIIVFLNNKKTEVNVPFYGMAKRITEFVELQTNQSYPSQQLSKLQNEIDKRKAYKFDFTFQLTETISINIVFI